MIHRDLAETASRNPGGAAILHGADGSLSWGGLAGHAAAVADHLRSGGLRRGDRFLLLWENGPEYAALFYGAMMAGATVVPLNPASPPERVAALRAHCAPRFAAASERAYAAVAEGWTGPPVLTVRPRDGAGADLDAVLAGAAAPRGNPGERPEDPALILYTSGSTGSPKGVVLTHRNLRANTGSILRYLELGPSDRTHAVLPFFYSYGNSVLLTHVAAGAALVVDNAFAFVNRSVETMLRREVTGFSGVPSHFFLLLHRSAFLDHPWPHLRYLTCAGGSLPTAHVETLRARLPHVRVHVMYGQTEGTARLSSLDPSLLPSKAGSVGKGIPGVTLRVVSGDGRDVAPGEVGEVIAAGENVMAGYYGDPEGTREVLRDGWLHTGDLATVDGEGYVYIKGRRKEFIKSGGYRVSPIEVEEALAGLPGVAEVAVGAVPDDLLGEAIVAFFVPREPGDEGEATERLRSAARQRLPHYMQPARYAAVPSIPKSENGKVRRFLLPDLLAGGPAGPS